VVGVEPHPNRLLARGFDPVLPFVRSLSKSFLYSNPSVLSLERTMFPIKPPFLPGSAKRTSKEVFY